MEISRRSWMYTVAYGLSDSSYGTPEVTSLCKFFWRFFLMLFIAWPLAITLACFGITIMLSFYVLLVAFTFLFSLRPAMFESDNWLNSTNLVEYKRWPRVMGFRVLPIYFVLAYVVLKLLYYLFLIPVIVVAVERPEQFTGLGVGFFGPMLLIFLLIKTPRSDVTRLVKEYLSAKKQKICPIIRFTE